MMVMLMIMRMMLMGMIMRMTMIKLTEYHVIDISVMYLQ